MKYELSEPFTLDSGEEIRSFELLEKVKAKHVRGIEIKENMVFDDFITIIGRLANQSPHVMNEIGYFDLQIMIGLVNGFLVPAGPKEQTTP